MDTLAPALDETKKRPPLRTGKVGKYEVLRVLGSGTTGSVYLARDPATTREVAVKLYSIDESVDREQATLIRKFFLTEVLLAQNAPAEQVWPDQQASVVSAPPPADDTNDDDGVLNRILMTFAGALAMASAMRMIIG